MESDKTTYRKYGSPKPTALFSPERAGISLSITFAVFQYDKKQAFLKNQVLQIMYLNWVRIATFVAFFYLPYIS